jgi:hypothetical protein
VNSRNNPARASRAVSREGSTTGIRLPFSIARSKVKTRKGSAHGQREREHAVPPSGLEWKQRTLRIPPCSGCQLRCTSHEAVQFTKEFDNYPAPGMPAYGLSNGSRSDQCPAHASSDSIYRENGVREPIKTRTLQQVSSAPVGRDKMQPV